MHNMHMRTNIYGNAHTSALHTHTNAHTHKHIHTHTHARANTARQDEGSDTLAEERCYVLKHNGSAIDTRPGKNTYGKTFSL